MKGPLTWEISGADDGIRTRDPHLGKVMLYQLSHVRVSGRLRYQSPAPPRTILARFLELLSLLPFACLTASLSALDSTDGIALWYTDRAKTRDSGP